MSEARASKPALEFKGRMMTLTILRLLNDAVDVLARELDRRINGAPGFFRHLPVVIDVAEVANSDLYLDLPGLAELLRTRDLVPVGIRGGDERWADAADVAGLTVFPPEAPARRPADAREAAAAAARNVKAAEALPPASAAANEKPASKSVIERAMSGAGGEPASAAGLIVTTPVRSGQQIYARGGDLIVLAPVSPGAELLADGHVHVYGMLNGRALAGVRGDTSARIFCKSFKAELVSVAGVYSVNEQFNTALAGQPVQVSLDGDKLRIESL